MRQVVPLGSALMATFLGLLSSGCGGGDGEPEREGPGSFIAAQVRGEVHPGDVGMDPQGRFFVVWGDDREGPAKLWARLYDATGEPITDEMPVSSTDMETGYASVRMSSDGQSIVAFSAEGSWGDYDSRIRRFDAGGRPIGEDLVVFRNSVRPDVELLPDGGFVVTDTVRIEGPYYGDYRTEVHVRRFDADGQPVGQEVALSLGPRSSGGDVQNPRVQTTPGGGYSVLWDAQFEAVQDPVFGARYLGAFSARFNLAGNAENLTSLMFDPPPLMADLRSQQNHFVNLPDGSVALLTRGIAVTSSTGPLRKRGNLQLLSAAGKPLGQAFDLHTLPEAADILPQDLALFGCSAASGCLLMATWISVPVDQPSEATVFARLFDAKGRPRGNPLAFDGAEFSLGRVSKYSAYPYVSGNARGDLVLVWRKTGNTGGPELEEINGFLYPGFAAAVTP